MRSLCGVLTLHVRSTCTLSRESIRKCVINRSKQSRRSRSRGSGSFGCQPPRPIGRTGSGHAAIKLILTQEGSMVGPWVAALFNRGCREGRLVGLGVAARYKGLVVGLWVAAPHPFLTVRKYSVPLCTGRSSRRSGVRRRTGRLSQRGPPEPTKRRVHTISRRARKPT